VKIYVGRSSHTDKLNVTADDLKHGAYRIVSGDDWLVLIGDDTDFTPIEPWPALPRVAPRPLIAVENPIFRQFPAMLGPTARAYAQRVDV
jgi:hypothetical protein